MVWSANETRGLKQSIRQCLAELGDSPDAVAGRLGDYGVVGVPGRADDCPVARYLKVVIGSERSVKVVGVLERRLRVTRHGAHLPLSMVLPRGVADFVRCFDEGKYPELVARPARRSYPEITAI
jgi:hypothetical protein